MTSIFYEFSATYDRFIKDFPEEPLIDEIRRTIWKKKFPPDEWLMAETRKMKDIMTPFWIAP